jgi:glutamyl/glutaminyl-tRNA synthetase
MMEWGAAAEKGADIFRSMPFTPRAPIPSGFTTRFAPAPTGSLHLGHVVSAIWVWGLARAHGGRVLLRIEDHDAGRSRPEFERGILDDLDWLGFEPDNGTASFRRGRTPLRQSDNLERYASRLAELEANGLAYPCDCSRSGIARALGLAQDRAESMDEAASTRRVTPLSGAARTAGIAQRAIEKAGVEPRYPGTCRTRGPDPTHTPQRRIRIDAGRPESFDDLRLGPQSQDPDLQCGYLLARDRSGNFTYQFCAVVDDIDQGIDLVIRGEDILASTGRQIRLARLLGRATPPRFLHHPLVRAADGRKLSKSDGDTGIRHLRAAKRSRDAVLGEAAKLAGLHPSGAPLAPHEVPALFG